MLGLRLGRSDGLTLGLIDTIDGNGGSVHDPILCVPKDLKFGRVHGTLTPSIITLNFPLSSIFSLQHMPSSPKSDISNL